MRRIGRFLPTLAAILFSSCWVWQDIPELNTSDASVDNDANVGLDGSAGAPGDAAFDGPCDADFDNDPKHCGTCGHDCLGGACESGACRPGVLLPGQAYPLITIDESGIYLANESGTIVRRDWSGGLTTLVEQQANPQRVAVDSTHVYWGNGTATTGSGNGDVRRIPKTPCSGCVEDIMTGLDGVVTVLLDAESIYFGNAASDGQIWKAPKGSVCGTATAPSSDCQAIATGLPTPTYMVQVDPFLFVVCTGTPPDYLDGEILRIPKLGCSGVPACPLVLANNQHWPSFIAATSERVYWSTYYGQTTMMVASDGSSQPVQLATGISAGIDLDATHVYWASTDGNLGAIRRVKLAGDQLEVFQTGLPNTLYDLRVYGGAIYFSDKQSLMVLAK